jgi:hypothetical protein
MNADLPSGIENNQRQNDAPVGFSPPIHLDSL